MADEKAPKPRPLWALFTEDGIPGWIGPEPRDGAEPVDGMEIEFLAAHRRLPSGEWVERDPAPQPTEAELAAQHEAWERAQAEAIAEAEAEARRLTEEEIARRAAPFFLAWATGDITQEDLKAHRDRIRAEVEAGR